ncbi:hypothetical protein OCU04_008285 [Sclerotinia nivalis]|uniref:ABC transporter domain-containing protein n=1 Tax=Sclerotinia nivalis TaxID=352851 RepID=A0A9X0AHT5_9HELO|nr:hypothetical protein OCU04_008285 [Sclerotinia nivalis]
MGEGSFLTLINLLASPLIRILQILPLFGTALGCFSRVGELFEKQEGIDSRIVQPGEITHGEGDSETECAGRKEVSNQEKGGYVLKSSDCSILSIRHASFGWGVETNLHDINLGPANTLQLLALSAVASLSFCKKSVGSSGAKISGDERQRLALARAITTRPAILLLDDVFSAVDETTKTSMREKLFGSKGILREQGTTIIRVTQDYKCSTKSVFKQFIEAADVVLQIDEKGNLQQLQPVVGAIRVTPIARIEGEIINVTPGDFGYRFLCLYHCYSSCSGGRAFPHTALLLKSIETTATT